MPDRPPLNCDMSLERSPLSEVTELLGWLIAIDSVNPGLVPGAPGEGEIARFVALWMESAGLDVKVSEVAPGRPNVVGTVRGSGGGRCRVALLRLGSPYPSMPSGEY